MRLGTVMPRWIVGTAFAAVGAVAVLTYLGGVRGGDRTTRAEPAERVTGRTRSYFIRAEEVRWNYAPAGRDLVSGQPFGEAAKVFVQAGPDRIGSTYTKCLYRGYRDASFRVRHPRPPGEEHLGLLGPVIRAEVGTPSASS